MEAAGDLCGVSTSLWSRLESGERMQLRMQTFLKLSEGTGITIGVLTTAAAHSLAESIPA